MIPGWLLLDAGADAAEDLLADVFGVARKQEKLDPLDELGFEAVVKNLFKSLLSAVGPGDRRALQGVQTMLDVNWPALSEAERESALAAIAKGLGGIPTLQVQQVDKVLALQGPRIVDASKKAAASLYDLPIAANFTVVDQKVVDFARASQAHYIRDQYGKRIGLASKKARDIVAKSLERGLDRYAIAEELKPAMEAIGVNRSVGYFGMIASVFAARARTWGTLSAFDEAGIEYMEWVAMLDEVTSHVCRFMDGKVVPVAAARDRHLQVAASEDPEAVIEQQPWVHAGRAQNGSIALFYKQGGEKKLIALVERSGVGAKDDRGEYSRAASVDQLVAAGITSPPAHAHCRSLLVPASAAPARAQIPASPTPRQGASAQALPYAGTGPKRPAVAGPAATPGELAALARPVRALPAALNPEALPEFTAEELAAQAAAEAKQKAIEGALAKLRALSSPTPASVASPLPTIAATGFASPKPNKVQIAAGKKKKPVSVLVDEVHGMDGFLKSKAAAAVESFDPAAPVLLVKENGVISPLNAVENYKILAAKLHGQTSVQGKVIDLDALAAKKPKQGRSAQTDSDFEVSVRVNPLKQIKMPTFAQENVNFVFTARVGGEDVFVKPGHANFNAEEAVARHRAVETTARALGVGDMVLPAAKLSSQAALEEAARVATVLRDPEHRVTPTMFVTRAAPRGAVQAHSQSQNVLAKVRDQDRLMGALVDFLHNNGDRHDGNVLVDDQGSIYLIDHDAAGGEDEWISSVFFPGGGLGYSARQRSLSDLPGPARAHVVDIANANAKDLAAAFSLSNKAAEMMKARAQSIVRVGLDAALVEHEAMWQRVGGEMALDEPNEVVPR